MVDTSAAEPCAAAGMGDGPGPRRPPFTASGAFSPVVAQASASGQAEVSPCPSQEPPPRGPCSESGRYGSAAGQTRVGSGLPRRVDSSELCGHRSRTPGCPTFRERQTQERAEAPLRAGGSVARERGSRAAACRRPRGQASSGPVTVDPPRCLPVPHLRAGRASGTAQACPVPAPPVWAGGGGSEGPLGRNLAFQKDLT